MRVDTSKYAVEFIFCGPPPAGHAAYPQEQFLAPLRFPWSKLNFPLLVVINWRSLLN